ncbi:MAG: hypothetical protein ABIJ18_04780 [archaeon]
MLQAKEKLEFLGHEVKMPPTQIEDNSGNLLDVREYYQLRKAEATNDSWIWHEKEKAMRKHFDKVE